MSNHESEYSPRKADLLNNSLFLRSILTNEHDSLDNVYDEEHRISTALARLWSPDWKQTILEPIYLSCLFHNTIPKGIPFREAKKPLITLIQIGFELEDYEDYPEIGNDALQFARNHGMYNPDSSTQNVFEYNKTFAIQVMSLVHWGISAKIQYQMREFTETSYQEPPNFSAFEDFIETLIIDEEDEE